MKGCNETKRIANLQSAYNLRRWMLEQKELDSVKRKRVDAHIAQIEQELNEIALPHTRFQEFAA